MESVGKRPRLENAADLGQERLQVGFLLRQQAADVGARCRPTASEADDVFDLGQRQPKPSPLLDKVEQTDHVVGIDPITRRGAARWRQDAARLVEPECLVADAAALHNFTDPHGVDGKPCPLGQSQGRDLAGFVQW